MVWSKKFIICLLILFKRVKAYEPPYSPLARLYTSVWNLSISYTVEIGISITSDCSNSLKNVLLTFCFSLLVHQSEFIVFIFRLFGYSYFVVTIQYFVYTEIIYVKYDDIHVRDTVFLWKKEKQHYNTRGGIAKYSFQIVGRRKTASRFIIIFFPFDTIEIDKFQNIFIRPITRTV